MIAPEWWIEDLERLRKEQNPTDERLPLYHELPVEEVEETLEKEPKSTVIVIDL